MNWSIHNDADNTKVVVESDAGTIIGEFTADEAKAKARDLKRAANNIDAVGKTKGDLRDALLALLSEKYELVYVAYNDELSPEQIEFLVANDFEKLWDSTGEFESDQRYDSCKRIIEDLIPNVIKDWELAHPDADFSALVADFDRSDEWDEVRYAIEERDSSDWMTQLARQSGRVLLRINCIDEDNGFAFQEVNPLEVLSKVGIESTPENEQRVAACLNECSPEFSVLLGYWIVGADVEAIYNLPSGEEDAEVEIVNPYLYLGNPFSGSGYITDEPLIGTVRVPRSELHTDKGAFGYSVNEIFGGLRPSSFECEIRPAAEPCGACGAPLTEGPDNSHVCPACGWRTETDAEAGER